MSYRDPSLEFSCLHLPAIQVWQISMIKQFNHRAAKRARVGLKVARTPRRQCLVGYRDIALEFSQPL